MKIQSKKIIEYVAMLVIWIGLVLLFGMLSHNFLTTQTFAALANRIPALVVISAGMTLVLIIGGIDLSVGSVLGLCGSVLGVAMIDYHLSFFAAALICLLIGLLAGAVNGVISVCLGIPSFIVTLGMLEVARGLAYLTTHSQTKYIGSPVEGLSGSISGVGLSPAFFISLLVIVAAQVALSRTVFGRYLVAIGTNESAVRLAGINPKPAKIAVYSLIGLLSGLGGVFYTSRLGSSDPNAGTGMELSAIAAVVIGGTSLMGGRGSVVNTFFGVLIIATLEAGLAQVGATEPAKRVITGGVIVAAVILDALAAAVATDGTQLIMKIKFLIATFAAFAAILALPALGEPVRIIFDTDIGNDVDDVLAISVLHALQARGECEILAMTITKPDELAGPFVDALNTFYGHPNIPIGCARPSSTEPESKFLKLANSYPHKLKRGSDAPEPTALLRKVLQKQPDHSVVMVQVGYFSNLGALLDTPDGRELVQQKVRLLSVMAGAFRKAEQDRHFTEFNVVKDIPPARKVAADWPTPIVWSGAEIGASIPYPAISIQRDFNYTPHHPAAEAYILYNPPPHERPTWDLTAALYAVLPDRNYFDLSPAGRVTVEEDGFTRFKAEDGGRDRYLILQPNQIARVKEALVQLASQPPKKFYK